MTQVRIRPLVGLLTVAALTALVAVAGCGGGKEVTRVDTDTTIDLSGNWNDSDSRMVSEALVQQITASPWVQIHVAKTDRRPVVIVGSVRNKTVEHIPTKTFIADLERDFINNGKVTVVASPEERDQVRTERADQQDFSSVETMKQWGREKGADFMLIGEINTIVDQEGGDQVKYYQVDAYLVNLEDNTKVWAGYEKIKKFVTR